MKIHFQIEYVDVDGNLVASFSSIDKNDYESRKRLHDLLDEYLDCNTDWENDNTRFIVSNACHCGE